MNDIVFICQLIALGCLLIGAMGWIWLSPKITWWVMAAFFIWLSFMIGHLSVSLHTVG